MFSCEDDRLLTPNSTVDNITREFAAALSRSTSKAEESKEGTAASSFELVIFLKLQFHLVIKRLMIINIFIY